MQPELSVQRLFGNDPYALLVAEIRDFAIFLLDLNGCIVSWNEGARLLFGYEKDEILGQPFRRLFVPEDLQNGIPQKEIEAAKNHGRAEDTRWHLKKEGSRFWANSVTTPLYDEAGVLKGFAKIVRHETQRKQVEDDLRRSEERFDLVARATNDAIWDWDLVTEHVWWNNNVKALFGYTAEEVESTPEWWKERVHPDDRADVVESIHHVIDGGGQSWVSEYRFKCADGSYAHVLDRGYLHRDETGAPLRILGAMMDVSMRKRLEEEKQIYERLANSSPDFIGICDLSGRPIYGNPAALRLIGLEDVDALKSFSMGELFFEADRDFILNEFLPRVVQEGEGVMEVRFRHFQSRAAIWMNFLVFVLRDAQNQPVALATISKDISARKRDEAEREDLLRRLEFERGRMATVFKDVPAFVAILRGPDHVFELVNPAYEQLIGHRDVIGKSVLEALPEVVDQGFLDLQNSIYSTGQSVEGREVPLKLQREPGGLIEERILDLYYQAIFEADGAISGIFVCGIDITELVRARRAAEDANRVKDEFLATLSHELRTPLTAILGWVNILQGGQIAPEEMEQGLGTIHRNARIQNQLVEDILDVSRVITGKLRLEVQPVDLTAIIEETVNTVLPTAQAKEIRLQRVLDAGTSIVSGDPARLQQIIWNLLSNAIKFTPKGGRVQIRLERINSHLEIVIADNGSGIAPEVLPHVFERFRQADSTSTRSYGGLGLGLSIVRHLAELHGGSVEAHSEGEGQGSIFTVKLPLAAVRAPELPEERRERRAHPTSDLNSKTSSLQQLNGLHVLLVDDQEDTRVLLKVVLEKCGAQVTVVASAEEAFKALQEQRPDVLLSDIGMPHEDGFSLIKRVRALPPEAGGQTPAAALTAFARVEDRVKVLRAGFQIHLPKPVEPLELTTVVANLAGRHDES